MVFYCPLFCLGRATSRDRKTLWRAYATAKRAAQASRIKISTESAFSQVSQRFASVASLWCLRGGFRQPGCCTFSLSWKNGRMKWPVTSSASSAIRAPMFCRAAWHETSLELVPSERTPGRKDRASQGCGCSSSWSISEIKKSPNISVEILEQAAKRLPIEQSGSKEMPPHQPPPSMRRPH
jgi:hypothetical protein